MGSSEDFFNKGLTMADLKIEGTEPETRLWFIGIVLPNLPKKYLNRGVRSDFKHDKISKLIFAGTRPIGWLRVTYGI